MQTLALPEVAPVVDQPDNELIALGLYEQLPSFDVIDALSVYPVFPLAKDTSTVLIGM
jgi:hypothetical protein